MRRLLVGMLIFLLSSPALADTTVQEDPETDDIMDVVEATHGHHAAERGVLAHTITMAEPWGNEDLEAAVINIRLSSDEGRLARRIWVDQNADGSLRTRVLGRKGNVLGHGNAWRPDERTLRVEFSKRQLSRRVDSYKWRVKVFQPCPQSEEDCVVEFDFVPDKGVQPVLHQL